MLALINANEVADDGETEETESSLRDHWKGFSLDTDTMLLVDSQDQVAAYADQAARNPVRWEAYVRVHPAHAGRGLGTWLTRWAHARAVARVPQAPRDARVTLELFASGANEAGMRLLENEGYVHVRTFQRMTVEFDQPPAEPAWPAGVRFRAFVPGEDDYAVYTAVQESFQDHWGHVAPSFDVWKQRAFQRESFDPALWFLAVDGDEVAGVSLCALRGADAGTGRRPSGWVETLGVRRPWRKRGLGLALLQHSFGELYRRGRRQMALGVDAENLTGAARLYERAGMTADRRNLVYEAELRPGRELATQSLEEAAE